MHIPAASSTYPVDRALRCAGLLGVVRGAGLASACICVAAASPADAAGVLASFAHAPIAAAAARTARTIIAAAANSRGELPAFESVTGASR